ncbi:amino acid synthesis family protein [Acrocarpospora sp. B8E8]|uniref:amino acid synthesis family protein n=1 Tax=Acrocarpospora sp. B8E8 TaxID=3153572 RepID=UPI00325D0ACF
MGEFTIRRFVTQVTEDRSCEGVPADRPLRKVVVGAILDNPFAGRYVEDLSPAVDWSPELGALLAGLAVRALGEPALSYGKGGIAGTGGVQEHVVAFITTPFGDALRKAVGGGAAWVSSATCVGAAGTPLTIPLAHKDALYVRDHYDAVTLFPADAPLPGEVLVAVAVANRGRLNARLGGLAAADVAGRDGLT